MVVGKGGPAPVRAAAFSPDKTCCGRKLPRQRGRKDLPHFSLAPTCQSPPKPPAGWQTWDPVVLWTAVLLLKGEPGRGEEWRDALMLQGYLLFT